MRACARLCATRTRTGTTSTTTSTTTTSTTTSTRRARRSLTMKATTTREDASASASATPFVVVLSPAKALDEAAMNASDATRATRPRFAERANAIAREARELKAGDLKTLMGVSDAIAKLNVERFGNFEKAATKACALAFDGPAFRHLKASTLKTEEEKAYLQKHLRILSGLYGCLRPYDAIAPYRLEMGTKWAPSGKDLYAYWGEDIALAIADDLDEQAATSGESSARPFVVNCASQEYWKSVKREALTKRGVDVYTMTFPGPAVYAKQARGAVVRHCVDARVASPEDLKTFRGTDGCWKFDAAASSEFNFVFARGAVKAGDAKPAKKAKKA